ncbi:MAG: hypothetical protein CMN00_07270 [Rickettsiales bacterium]|nr:hypothetical protein [Rickettsiales bacterium]
MNFNFKIISVFCLVIFFKSFVIAAPPEIAPKKWPCDQVYNPKLDLKALWQGPEINDSLKNWWKDDDVIEVVSKLSDPILPEENGTKLIEDFAKKYTYFGILKKKEQKIKLINLFSGLYQKAADRRNRQYVGIIKFVERQDTIRKTIGSSSKRLRELRKNNVSQEDPEFIKYSSQMEWNTRVFDQRTRLTEYVCEEPVFLEQRIGYQARKILTYLK